MTILLVGFAFSAPVSADEAVVANNEKALIAYSSKNRPNKSTRSVKDYQPVNSWKPYCTWIGNVQSQTTKSFMQFNVGLGFLYFSKVSGSLNATPAPAGSMNSSTSIPLSGKIGYNRTPVFQYSVGYRFYNWFKLALALEHQTGVNIQSNAIDGKVVGTRSSNAGLPVAQFRSHLDLNTIFAKFMFELPWVVVWKNWMNALYLNAGVGPCWQSWTDVLVYENAIVQNVEGTFVNTLSQKYPASAFWQIDLGIRSKLANPTSTVSFLLGCRFSSWGQSRNIGKLSQQGNWGYGIADPFRVKMLYSFVPYIGAQWDF